MKKAVTTFTSAWKEHLSVNLFAMFFGIALIELLIASKYCKYYIGVFASHGGIPLADPILALFTPHDFSVIIFLLFHGILLMAFISLMHRPKELSVAFQAYALLMVFRTLTIYLIPLKAPSDMIFLSDPLANLYMHHNGNGPVVNDLFFSGHVSSSFLFFLVARGKVVKRLILAATVAVAVMILWQKVHYTVDVVAAPFFSVLALYLSNLLAKKVFAPAVYSAPQNIQPETAKSSS